MFQQRMPDEEEPAVRWLPFQLNPDLPDEGIPRKEYLERKFNVDFPAYACHARVAVRVAGAELALDVFLARNALIWQVRVELERQPAHGRLFLIGHALLEHPQGGFQAALTDETPGSDDVRNDVDGELGLPVHALVLSAGIDRDLSLVLGCAVL